SSAMQAYLTLGSGKHLRAARNGFDLLSAQSYPTGGWGPDEKLTSPDAAELYTSLTATHNSFETPCGAYAHFKLTRYLLRVTREARYGDSMERVLYNTVLGAKPLQSDGRAFYYADYHRLGRKVYSTHRFPCCSGTLPQVATDYGINSYLRAPDGLYVNLYIPSRVRWSQAGVRCALRQQGNYPFADTISARLELERPVAFTLYLRIPSWADGARIAVRGAAPSQSVEPGRFMALERTWRNGDEVELQLPCRPRLEAITAEHPRTVALLWGPLVLFALGADAAARRPSAEELLAVRKVDAQRWQAEAEGTAIDFLPYTALQEETYATFLTLRS
ncbi:MAG: glycoside hydrolase family 127 protein, partial [Gammaproteobacteria bacterium]|nr:glycoside hydrolase family 127 protein [Gammaproteobacteria bacterium]